MPRLLLSCGLLLLTALASAAPVTEFFVSTQGRDTNPGTREKPFATLDHARDVVRGLKSPTPVTVWLRGGIFRLDKPLALTAADSGTTYRAFGTEAVSLMGGMPVPAESFGPVTDFAILSRLDTTAKPHIVVADLGKLGLQDFGKPWPDSFVGYNGWPELFFGGERMQLARWPNTGFTKMGKVLDKGSVPRVGEKPDRGGKFQYTDDRPARWLSAPEVYLEGYWCFKWFSECLKVAKIDPTEKSISFLRPHVYGIGGYSGGDYFALNLLEELDSPGEYYLDRKTGLLYFWPPADLKTKPVALSTLGEPLVTMTDCANVTLRGLTFEVSRGAAVKLTGGENNLLAACTMRDLAGDAVSISGGKNNGVVACELYNLGGGGISLSGGDRKTLTPCGNYADNNHIHHFGRIYRTHHDAINLNGCGCRATHNLIHDAPHHAMDFGGNDNLVEFNEVYRVCLETDDAGAIYTGRNWTVQGNIIRYNFFHDIGGGPAVGNQAIYLDDCAAGTTCYGNIISRVGRAFLIGGGRDNIIENNIMIDCPISVHIDNRGVGIAKTHDENWGTLTSEFKSLPIMDEPWKSRYPHLPTYLTDQPGYPKYNLVARNLMVRCGKMNIAREAQELSTFTDNFATNEDPGFADAARLNFDLTPGSFAFQKIPGFKPIPFAKIGPFRDQYRQAMPLVIPALSPAPQSFVGELTVTIGTRYPGGVVRYTLDGTDPTAKSAIYAKPLKLTKTTTVKACAFAGNDATEVAEGTYRMMQLGEGHGLYLSELEPDEVLAHGGLKRDTGYTGAPLVIGGRAFAHGLTTHAETTPEGGRAFVVYSLRGWLRMATRFRAWIGIESAAGKEGSCTFIVEAHRSGQWEKVYESPVLRAGQPPVEVNADIHGSDQLRLRVTDGGDGIASDHAAWGDALLQ
jgi:hypothetical protein